MHTAKRQDTEYAGIFSRNMQMQIKKIRTGLQSDAGRGVHLQDGGIRLQNR